MTFTQTDQMRDLGMVFLYWDDAGLDPDFYAWRIYRHRSDEAAWTLIYETVEVLSDYTFDDYLAAANVNQEWKLVQVTVAGVGDPQVETDMDTDELTPEDDGYWLIHPTESAFNFRIYHVKSHSQADNYEQAVIGLIDRGYHVEQGTDFGDTGSLEVGLTDRAAATARQQRQKFELIKASYSEVWLRTPFGDVKQIALGQLSFDRDAGVGLAEHGTLTVPYTEVA